MMLFLSGVYPMVAAPSTTTSSSLISVLSFFAVFAAIVGTVIFFEKNKDKIKKIKGYQPNTEEELIMMNIAFALGGTLTVAEVAINSNFSMEEAEQILNYFVERKYIYIRITENGAILYEFPRISENTK